MRALSCAGGRRSRCLRAGGISRLGALALLSAAVLVLILSAMRPARAAQELPPPTDMFNPDPIERRGPQVPRPANPALAAEIDTLQARANGADAARAAPAAWQLGLLALHGLVAGAQPGDARHWFARAQALGERRAAAGLAWCAMEGCGATPDPAAARRWIDELRGADLGRAQYLQWLLNEQLAPLAQAPSTAQASAASAQAAAQRQLLQSAASHGNTAARVELGFEHLAAGRMNEALRAFENAAALSPAAAANAIELRDRVRPAPTAREARTRGQAAGQEWLTLARRHHRGEGAPANFAEALRYYQLAANAGNAEARRMLALITSRPAPDGGVDVAWMRDLASLDLTQPNARIDGGPPSANALQRDATPLVDLLPPRWRDEPAPMR